MNTVELIARKRDGGELDEAELEWLVGGYLAAVARADDRPVVSEGQMAALLMAGVLRGFTDAEARALTRVLVRSGDTLDLSVLPGPTIDKHSTGGVGDATTLLVAPLLASAGAQLVKLSGRGLGHTGGTLDKLESVPGLRTELSGEEILRIVGDVGCVVAAQSDRLVPGDRAIYALRDLTATVASAALIASSVMSKKLAGGADTIVLDVKAGDGAFMPTVEAADALARLCVSIGVDAGRRCSALVTDMDQPLGRAAGNALEIREVVEALSAPPAGRLAGLALDLAAQALALARDRDVEVVRADLHQGWTSGDALDRLRRMILAQGGDPAVCDRPADVLPSAPVVRSVEAPGDGTISVVPARAVGEIAAALGAGRQRKGDPIDPTVGVVVHVEVGDLVRAGQPIATVHARSEGDADAAAKRLAAAVQIGTEPVPPRSTVLRRVGTVRDTGASCARAEDPSAA
jgi:pyrimidine-nucleoside phosphorylase